MPKERLIDSITIKTKDGHTVNFVAVRYFVGIYCNLSFDREQPIQGTCTSVQASNRKARKIMKAAQQAGDTVEEKHETEVVPCGQYE